MLQEMKANLTAQSAFSPQINPDAARWDAFVAAHPDAHTLQLAAWGTLKSQFGWKAQRVAIVNRNGAIIAGAGVLYRPLPLHLGTMAYIPAGPLFAVDASAEADAALWRAIRNAARSQRAAFVKVEPCNWYRPRPDLPKRLIDAGFQPSPQTVQPPRTVVLDISGSEEDIRKRMNESTRRKTKLGPKHEVNVRVAKRAEVSSFNQLMHVTGQRDGFGVHDPAYYEKAFELFAENSAGNCALLLASYAGQDLAGLMIFRCGENAYYLYGASSNEERNRMPTYIIQWEAIRWAKAQGAIRYDLWGAPDEDETTLEAQFQERRDGLWGVYGFKRGFGGQVVRSVGAWDKPYNRLLYTAYRWYLSRRER